MNPTLARPDSLSPEEHRILGSGRVYLSNLANVAGALCWGWWARGLVLRGLMTERPSANSDGSWLTVSAEGRRAYLSYGAPYVPHEAR